MLATAISHLPNLETIEVRNFWSLYQGGRLRDGVPWKSYGWSELEKATGMPTVFRPAPNPHDTTSSYYSDVFQNVLAAAIDCTHLKSLVAHLRSEHRHAHACGLLGSAFWTPELTCSNYRKGLSHLETFMVTLDGPRAEFGVHDVCLDLENFATYLTSLRHLRLNWLGVQMNNITKFDSLMTTLSFRLSLLRRFELGTVELPISSILDLKCFQSLEDLCLFSITLTGPKYSAIQQDDAWSEVLKSLAANMPKLRNMNLKLLKQLCCAANGDRWTGWVCFKETSEVQVNKITDKSLSSGREISDKRDRDISSAVNKAIPLMVVDSEAFRIARGAVFAPFTDSEGPSDAESDEDDTSESETYSEESAEHTEEEA